MFDGSSWKGLNMPGIEMANAFVNGAYRLFLNRMPEPAGLQSWSNVALVSGPDPVLTGIAASVEYAGLFPTSALFVDSLYRKVLGREPDPGRIGWIALLEEGRGDRGRVMSGFLDSPEYKQKFAAYATISQPAAAHALAVVISEPMAELREEAAYKLGCVFARSLGLRVCEEFKWPASADAHPDMDHSPNTEGPGPASWWDVA